jgi:hypothetical protein
MPGTGLMRPKNGWRLDLLRALPRDEAAKRIAGYRPAGHIDGRRPTTKAGRTKRETPVDFF